MKILVGISGGVDSAFAAHKLLSDGHEVEGAVLVMHEYTEISAARDVAESIGIHLHEIDCRDSFNNIIKGNFVSEYTKGRTPNPCIICNERVKFAVLYDFAMKNGFDAIATGHYADIREINDGVGVRYALATAEDTKKDQTYMLYRLPQNILSKLILPLSVGTKSEIRDAAKANGVLSADRPDSQEICFLPNGGHTDFIESVAGKSCEGDFIDCEGRILGRHKGIIHYTVGQRKGLGISLGERAFVTDIDPENNTVTLSPLMSGVTEIKLTDAVYSGMREPLAGTEREFLVKLRYTAPLVRGVAKFHSEGEITLTFAEPCKCAPGQSAVLYDGGVVMCGGFINKG